jgi:hypothetical protein
MTVVSELHSLPLSLWEWDLIVDALDELAAHTPDWHEADRIAGLSIHIDKHRENVWRGNVGEG